MSRVDRSQSQVTYLIHFDGNNEYIKEIEVLSLTANMAPAGEPAYPANEPFTKHPHFAFTTVYKFDKLNEVEEFEVPTDAAKMLK